MSFQLRERDTRPYQYPHAQDPNFLGYDRDADRWKVDASGIHLYASGLSVELDKNDDSVSVWSASGTPDIPVYLQSNLDHSNDSVLSYNVSSSGTPVVPTYIDGGFVSTKTSQETDSIRVYSASGTSDVPVYITSPVEVEVNIGDTIKVMSASGTPAIPIYQEQARFDAVGNQYTVPANSLVTEEYDYISMAYASGNLTGVTYKAGGSLGTTVAVLSLGYDGDNNLTSVERM